MAEDRQSGDLLLNHAQYAYVLDENKGTITTYVGPNRQAISQNDRPVIFNPKIGEFEPAVISRAIQSVVKADEGSYVVLINPAAEKGKEHPQPATSSPLPLINYGRKINLPGPIRFPLWPGQVAEVVPGHQLRSNEYLLIRVYNEDEARENWGGAVLRPQVTAPLESEQALEEGAEQEAENASLDQNLRNLILGQLMIIRGDEYSFYIPPTGIEVLKDDHTGEYARRAVTLERLEYCILLDENGEKRYVEGPAVVFPKPTEEFVVEGGRKKFKAIELNNDMGLYIKVIADYDDHSVGDELFITGKQQKIYYPRPEHAVVNYGNQSIHYATAIPEGEARYLLNKDTGKVALVKGPQMCLPDPRREVFVRRILDQKTVDLLFPGNEEARKYNAKLETITEDSFNYLSERAYRKHAGSANDKTVVASYLAGTPDEFERKTEYTPPRTITLDTKYEGAVAVGVWTGYAVQVVSKSGDRKVVPGPTNILLEYDESLEATEFSTGTPKSRDRTLKTVYLRVQNNKVSDQVTAVTSDLVEVNTTLSYRVNFEGDSEKWFNVEDYVGFLVEHSRSIIRNAVKHHGIEAFMANSADIIRDTVLGAMGEDGKRPGRVFEENGMRIYDVEILNTEIDDPDVERLLQQSQYEVVSNAIETARRIRTLAADKDKERIAQERIEAKGLTEKARLNDLIEAYELQNNIDVQNIKAEKELSSVRQSILDDTADSELARKRQQIEIDFVADEAKLDIQERQLVLKIDQLREMVAADVARAEAIDENLAKAITVMGDKVMAEKVAAAIGPLAAIQKGSIGDTFNQLFETMPGLAGLFPKNPE